MKEIITNARLFDLYNKLINMLIEEKIEKQIREAKEKINMSNKKSYLLSYKLWKKNT